VCVKKPYAAFVDAFDSLLSSILRNRANETDRIQSIRDALDGDEYSQHLLLDIMPQLTKILSDSVALAGTGQHRVHSSSTTSSKRFYQNSRPFSLRQDFGNNDSSKALPRHSGNVNGGGIIEQRHQFRYLFLAFVRAVCNGQPHPIILVLDDLQWADVSSLELLKAICQDSESTNLIIIGAYRSQNLAYDNHSLKATLNYLRESTSMENRYFDLFLGNFKPNDLNDFVAASLELSPKKTRALSDVIMRKTNGNIFHVKEFLKHLESEKLLWYDLATCHWKWDVEQISGSTDLSENVIDLVTSRILELPEFAISILKIASCLWFSFDVHILEFIVFQARAKLQNPQPINEKSLLSFGVMEANLKVDVATQTQVNHSLELASEKGLLDRMGDTGFKFSHDKVREATYKLIQKGEERNHQHYIIGEILWQMYHSKRSQQWMLFSSVDQLNKISSQISTQDLRLHLAKVNLEAAECATSLSSFLPATAYVKAGLEFLGNSRWKDHYDLCLKLYTKLAALQSSLGFAAETANAIEEAVRNAKSFDDKLPLLTTLIESLSVQGKLNESLDLGFDVLEGLGEYFPKTEELSFKRYVRNDSESTAALLKSRTDATILALPLLSDQKKQFVLRILNLMIDPAFHTGQLSRLYLIINRMVRISLLNGLGRPSGVAFALYGFSLNSKDGNRRKSYEYGRLALTLQERLQAPEYDCRVLTYVYVLLNHWQEPLGKSLTPLLIAHHAGMSSGDIDYAFQAAGAYLTLYWYSGRILDKGLSDAQRFTNQMIDYNQEKAMTIYKPLFQCMWNMASDNNDWRAAVLLKGDFISDTEFEEKKFANTTMMSYQMQLAYYFGDIDLAEAISSKLQEVSKSFNAHYLFVARLYFFGLIALRVAMDSRGRRRRKQINISQKIIKEMEQWTRHGGLNCLNKLLLLKAEYSACQLICATQERLGCLRRTGDLDFRSVQKEYDVAIVTSTRTGFRNDAALAAERAYEFCSWHGHLSPNQKYDETFLARSYFAQSCRFYCEWGALAKVNQLLQSASNQDWQLDLDDVAQDTAGTNSFEQRRTVDHTRLGLSHLDKSDKTKHHTFFATTNASDASNDQNVRILRLQATP
jgi:predicted ATPase